MMKPETKMSHRNVFTTNTVIVKIRKAIRVEFRTRSNTYTVDVRLGSKLASGKDNGSNCKTVE